MIDGEVPVTITFIFAVTVPSKPVALMVVILLVDVMIYVHVPEAIVRPPEPDVVLVSSIFCRASSAHDDAILLAPPDCCKEKSVFDAITPDAMTDTMIATPIAEIRITERSAIYPLFISSNTFRVFTFSCIDIINYRSVALPLNAFVKVYSLFPEEVA